MEGRTVCQLDPSSLNMMLLAAFRAPLEWHCNACMALMVAAGSNMSFQFCKTSISRVARGDGPSA